jgi:hypothetical protein
VRPTVAKEGENVCGCCSVRLFQKSVPGSLRQHTRDFCSVDGSQTVSPSQGRRLRRRRCPGWRFLAGPAVGEAGGRSELAWLRVWHNLCAFERIWCDMTDRERRGFWEFVAARSTALQRAAYLTISDVSLAQDLVQESLTKTNVAWPRLRNPANAEAYTRRVITTTALSWVRSDLGQRERSFTSARAALVRLMTRPVTPASRSGPCWTSCPQLT